MTASYVLAGSARLRTMRRRGCGCCRGFTLVELMVAVAVASLLFAMLMTVTSTSTEATNQMASRMVARGDIKVAMDFLERDFAGLIPAETGRTPLTIVSEQVVGRPGAAAEIASFWIMMTCRPVSGSDPGAIRLLSYRLLYADPMTPASTDGRRMRPALYRSVLTPIRATDLDALNDLSDKQRRGLYFASDNNVTRMWDEGLEIYVTVSKWWLPSEADLADGHDLHADFWAPNWSAYEDLDGGGSGGIGRVLMNDYLTGDVVDVAITLRYLDSKGVPQSFEMPADAVVNLTNIGFEGHPIGDPDNSFFTGDHTPNTPVALTVTLTALRAEGTRLYRPSGTGRISLPNAIIEHGYPLSRTLPLDRGL